jgi:uncharacterized protein YeaO (DUF488 family)
MCLGANLAKAKRRYRAVKLHIKRAYDAPSGDDGFRVLVDRLWPRGLSKANAHIGLWAKEVAPSTELRKWFAHDPAKWQGFRERYIAELEANRVAVDALVASLVDNDVVTLLYATHEEEFNNAVVLRDYLKQDRR